MNTDLITITIPKAEWEAVQALADDERANRLLSDAPSNFRDIARAGGFQCQSGWIKCAERMPPKEAEVLLLAPETKEIIRATCLAGGGDFNREGWFNLMGEPIPFNDLFTHWQPLPPLTEPPKEETK